MVAWVHSLKRGLGSLPKDAPCSTAAAAEPKMPHLFRISNAFAFAESLVDCGMTYRRDQLSEVIVRLPSPRACCIELFQLAPTVGVCSDRSP